MSVAAGGGVVRGLLVLQYALIVAYVVLWIWPGDQMFLDDPATASADRTLLAPIPPIVIGLLILRGRRHREDRGWTYVLAAAVTVFFIANLTHSILTFDGGVGGWTTRVTEVVYLVPYLLGAVAVVLAVRRFKPRVREGIVVETILGGLAALSLAALLVHPLIEDPEVGLARSVVLSLYVVLAILLVAILGGGVAMGGGFLTPAHIGLTAGLAGFVVVGLLYAEAVVHQDPRYAIACDVGWALSLTFLGHGAWLGSRQGRRISRMPREAASMTVTSVAMGCAVLVLAVAAVVELPWYVAVLAVATAVAGGIRTALAMWRLRELVILRHQLSVDDLTGLMSRRAFYDELEKRLAVRGDGVLGVGLLDLDRFKRVNDTHGHAAGDDVLATFGRRVRDVVDVHPLKARVCRLGGDEFAFLVADVPDYADLVHCAEAIAEAARISCGEGPGRVQVSASVGLALAPAHGSNRVELLRAADHAMYVAKQAGRDRVVVYDADGDPRGHGRPVVRG